jgi:cellulose synthase/poly-beta-1,6-N-acetylglucosamine synthase-like glycosyltransferase
MSITSIISWLLTVAQAPLFAAWALLTLYLLFLTASALIARLREPRKTPDRDAAVTKFSVLIPAHDEELVIADCLKSLTSFDYPADMYRVYVIADNCTDGTAKIASSMGAQVMERFDDSKRGKPFALDWALTRLLKEDKGWTDSVVVFDADTQADGQFLRYMDEKLRGGALVMQGQYNLHNPFDNWRTGLLYSALLLHNRLRPLARQAMGWTTLLKGNGMCFSRQVVERFGWKAYGLAEDIEYTTMLLDAGIRVESVPRAVLYAQAPQTSKQADSQRMRWEGGRLALARRDGLRLLRTALRHRSLARLDWAMDLLTPPMGILIGLPIVMLVINVPLSLLLGWPLVGASWGWLGLLLGAGVYVVGGLMISGAQRKAYVYLLCTPLFLVWKLKVYATMLLGRGPRGWVRTERTTMS